jgi:pseudaminic acid synthase
MSRRKLDFSRCFIIAEMSANHGQDLKRAVRILREAKDCGADAIKFQTYTPDTLTIDVDNKHFRIKHPKWGGQTLYQLYKKAYTPWAWFKELKKEADKLDIVFFSTAFDRTSVDFLEGLHVGFHKIASFELVDLPLIRYVARTGKDLILSTGMATAEEISEAVRTARKAGAGEIVLLKCVSSYPARAEEMNLRTIPDMERRFRCSVGLSDHTLGTEVSVAAVALGARVLEKHFTLSRKIRTADSFFSLEPAEFRGLVSQVRTVEAAKGRAHYGLTPGQQASRVFRRSLFVVEDVKVGERFTDRNVRSIRPSGGLAPKYFEKVLSKRALRDIKRGTPLSWALIRP